MIECRFGHRGDIGLKLTNGRALASLNLGQTKVNLSDLPSGLCSLGRPEWPGEECCLDQGASSRLTSSPGWEERSP